MFTHASSLLHSSLLSVLLPPSVVIPVEVTGKRGAGHAAARQAFRLLFLTPYFATLRTSSFVHSGKRSFSVFGSTYSLGSYEKTAVYFSILPYVFLHFLNFFVYGILRYFIIPL